MPAEEHLITAEPFAVSASWAAESVTVWYVSQLAVVNIRLAPDDTVISLSPENLATDTVLLAAGCIVNLTWKLFVNPSLTLRDEKSVAIWTLLAAKFAVMVLFAVTLEIVSGFVVPE
jgi:hypothetical protein